MRTDYTWPEIERILRDALAHAAQEDGDLMRVRANERAVVHRLAVYLEHAFWGWNTDCEYNRQGGRPDPKTIGHDIVVPDIVVHRRGPLGPNLLAIEVKPTAAGQPARQGDRQKLQGYLDHHGYTFAALVTYGEDGAFGVERIERPPA